MKAELVSLCRDRQSGGLGNFIEIIELLFSQIRPEWEKISYQIIQESGRILHSHTEEAQSFTAIKADKMDLEEAEKYIPSTSSSVASSGDYIDVSKLHPALIDMAILHDSLRHKMTM